MAKSLSISNPIRNISQTVKKVFKFHYIFSISLLLIGVAFTTYYINDILNNTQPSTEAALQVGFSDRFDTETIKKINEFKYRDENTISPPPSGRTNPFTE